MTPINRFYREQRHEAFADNLAQRLLETMHKPVRAAITPNVNSAASTVKRSGFGAKISDTFKIFSKVLR